MNMMKNSAFVGNTGHFDNGKHGARLGRLRGLGRHESRQHEASSGSLRLSRFPVYLLPIQLDEQVARLHL